MPGRKVLSFTEPRLISRQMKIVLFATLVLLALPAYARPSGGAAAPRGADALFLAARDAFRTGDSAKVDALYPRLSSTLYEPYVAYYALHMHLSTANPEVIRKFLARPADSPVYDKLRGEWLKQLADNQQWDAFTDEYPHLAHEDSELLCDSLEARRMVQPRGAMIEARRLWSTGEADPEDCMPMFDAALAAGFIGENDVWVRIRKALEAGNVTLAKEFATRLPAQYAPFSPMLDQAYANPGNFLAAANLAQAGPAERLVALFALRRLAKQSPDIALARWDKISADFSEAEQLYFYGWLGYEGAHDQDDRALQWYKEAKNSPLSPIQLAWRTRAALRALNWREVIVSIDAMPPYQRQREAWRYWKGRALEALGWRNQAAALFRGLEDGYGYYDQLAANELAQRASTPGQHRADPSIVLEVKTRPGIQRALALYRLALYPEAAREWAWAIRNYDDKHLLAASEIAQRNGVYDRSIQAAEKTRKLHDFNLRYPTPYREELQAHVRDNDLDEAWVYGLMRQESRFAMHANSVVGASGLMQIMPATARWVARKMGLKHYHNALLTELGTNLKLGTYYLKSVLSRLDNNPVLASAAYNAGPNRADQWRDAHRPLEGAIYIETIPFYETRDYVRKVMSNTAYYSRLFGQPTVSLKQRLGVIPPRAAGQAAMADER